MHFPDLNFKISIIGALHDLGYYNEEAKAVQDENESWEEDHKPIPAVVAFYRDLEINPAYLAGIESLQPDGGDSCYQYLFNYWDGEDDQFDIHSIAGIKHLTNLKVFDPISMIASDGIDYSPLLRCTRLQTVSGDHVKPGIENELVLKQLEERGVTII